MERAIKQRLLGGLVLVAGAALFLPMLLDGSGASLTMPPMPEPPKVPALEAIAPKLDAQVVAADASVAAAHESPVQEMASVAEETDVLADAAASGEAALPTPKMMPVAIAAKPAITPATSATAPVVAAAAATAAAKATTKAAEEAKRLAALNAVSAKAEQQKAEQLAAQKIAEKAQPALPKTTAKPSVLPQAWVVQVASLTSKDKADALVQSLRKKSYHAVAHKQGDVWKVVIGPELRREIADSIKSRLAADPELKLSGWVQAYKP